MASDESMQAEGPRAAGAARPDRARVLEVVLDCLVESLAVERGKLSLETLVFKDLKADSLDFLEMLFGVERAFGIKLREKTLQLLLRTDFDEARLTPEGYLGPDDVAKLEPWLPALARHDQKASLTPKQVFGFVTIESLVLLIEGELAG